MHWVACSYRPVDTDVNRDIYEFCVKEMFQMEGPPKWAVAMRANWVWTKRGEWEQQPQPSSRTASFLKRARYDTLTEAMRAGEQAAEHLDD